MSECVVDSCGRPTQDALCSTCLMELVTDLRQLDNEGVDHKSHRRPGLCEDLEVTITRQSRMNGLTGVTSRPAETPLPYHPVASELADVLYNTLSTWARDVAETYPHLTPTWETPAQAAAWLADQAGLLAEHPAANELHDEITHVVAEVRQVVDRTLPMVYAGRCEALIEGVECKEHLYARPDRKTVTCRTCGTEHAVEVRRERMLRTIGHYPRTAPDISRAFPGLFGLEVTEDRIRQWKHRGKLLVHDYEQVTGRPLYLIRDVMNLLMKEAA